MKELQEFLDVVGKDDFGEGHEVLEVKWKEWKKIPEKREESYILKGLINGSTAIALKIMKREKPAEQVWATFLKYSPLIDSIDSKYSTQYKEARELLLEKSIHYKVN